MEPIHYLRALRRRWWVIVAAVLVAGTAAWVTTEVAPVRPVAPKATGYSATTVLWNPGAPIVGQGSPITDLTVLANLVGLPEVSSIAAKRMHFDGTPLDLSQQVYATTDPTTGFLSISGTAPDPADGGADLERVLAVLDRVPGAAAEHEDRSAAATRAGADPEAHRAWRRRADRRGVARAALPARAGPNGPDLAHGAPSRARRAGARRGPGGRSRWLQVPEEPERPRAARVPVRAARGHRAGARPGAFRHADPVGPPRRGGLRRARARRGPRDRPPSQGPARDPHASVLTRGGGVPPALAWGRSDGPRANGRDARRAGRPSSSRAPKPATARRPWRPTWRSPTRRRAAGSWWSRPTCGARPSTRCSACRTAPAWWICSGVERRRRPGRAARHQLLPRPVLRGEGRGAPERLDAGAPGRAHGLGRDEAVPAEAGAGSPTSSSWTAPRSWSRATWCRSCRRSTASCWSPAHGAPVRRSPRARPPWSSAWEPRTSASC